MRSLYLKFAMAFMITGFMGVMMVAIVARTLTYKAFIQFNVAEKEAEITEDLTLYYKNNGSWGGVTEVVAAPRSGEDNQVEPQLPFLIASTDGRVLVVAPLPKDETSPFNRQVPPDLLASGTTIMVDGHPAGVVIFQQKPDVLAPREHGFFGLVDKVLMWAALAGITIGIVFSLLITRTLTRPIRELSQAALQISEGKLNQQVEVTAKDEIGILAASFNTMSTELARADRLRRQMTADIAHELRNPMTVLGIHLEGLQDGTLQPTEERINVLYNIQQQMRRIIDDLRDLSLADANELPLYKSKTDPGELLSLVTRLYGQMAQEKGINIEYIEQEGLPTIHADPHRITQVIGNLVHNAIDNTPEGGQVTLSADIQDEWLVFRVKDTGSGIAQEELPNIFKRFYRIDPARQTELGNSGLGLAIARSITEAHSGTIEVESTVGEGSAFSVLIPLES